MIFGVVGCSVSVGVNVKVAVSEDVAVALGVAFSVAVATSLDVAFDVAVPSGPTVRDPVLIPQDASVSARTPFKESLIKFLDIPRSLSIYGVFYYTIRYLSTEWGERCPSITLRVYEEKVDF
jgi:hypothetical protein